MSPVARMQHWMVNEGIEAYIIPHRDPFGNETTAERDRYIQWLTGFTGSAGLCAITPTGGAIFVDGRYTEQGKREIEGAGLQCHPLNQEKIVQWIVENTPQNSAVHIDPWRIGIKEFHSLREAFEKHGCALKTHKENPIQNLWTERPPLPVCALEDYTLAGEESHEKCKRLADHIKQEGNSAFLITQCDSLMWLMNVRGAHSPASRLAFGNGLLEANGTLWVDMEAEYPEQLHKDRPHIRWVSKKELLKQANAHQSLAITNQSALWWQEQLPHSRIVVDSISKEKSVKNSMELITTAAIHRQEGLYVTTLIHKIKTQTLQKEHQTEQGLEELLQSLRKENPAYKGNSFASIIAMNAHGAIIHYKATKESNAVIDEGVLLLDVGGQYEGGTTDATRTLLLNGKSPKGYKVAYTRVLKGHIALMTTRCPKDTETTTLDAIAREPLKELGDTYPHGTGHGVSVGLCVHESPYRIGQTNPMTLKANIILTNEPGYYETNSFGVRLEDCMVVREDGDKYAFESLTRIPFDRDSIEKSILTKQEIHYIDAYHHHVYNTIKDQTDDENLITWLASYTKPL